MAMLMPLPKQQDTLYGIHPGAANEGIVEGCRGEEGQAGLPSLLDLAHGPSSPFSPPPVTTWDRSNPNWQRWASKES